MTTNNKQNLKQTRDPLEPLNAVPLALPKSLVGEIINGIAPRPSSITSSLADVFLDTA